jgi:hypothetical protein
VTLSSLLKSRQILKDSLPLLGNVLSSFVVFLTMKWLMYLMSRCC